MTARFPLHFSLSCWKHYTKNPCAKRNLATNSPLFSVVSNHDFIVSSCNHTTTGSSSPFLVLAAAVVAGSVSGIAVVVNAVNYHANNVTSCEAKLKTEQGVMSQSTPSIPVAPDHQQQQQQQMQEQQEQQQTKTTKKQQMLPICGLWCGRQPDKACHVDTRIMACKGEYCRTTCELWDRFTIGSDSRLRPVTCSEYKDGIGYAVGAVTCPSECLIPEIRPERFPAPLGLGLMCQPDAPCMPGASYGGHRVGPALGTLQCPCNWFGSTCPEHQKRIQGIQQKQQFDNDNDHATMKLVTIQVDPNDWREILKDHKPGGVIRIIHYDNDENLTTTIPICHKDYSRTVAKQYHNHQREMAAAVGPIDPTKVGELPILLSQPSPNLHPVVTATAWQLWNTTLSSDDTYKNKGNEQDDENTNNNDEDGMFVTPSIGGFFNQNYEYLMDVLIEQNKNKNDNDNNRHVEEKSNDDDDSGVNATGAVTPMIQEFIVVATGSGLAGALSAIDYILQNHYSYEKNPPRIHLYYGLRNISSQMKDGDNKNDHQTQVDVLPFQEYLEKVVSSGKVNLVIVESQESSNGDYLPCDNGTKNANKIGGELPKPQHQQEEPNPNVMIKEAVRKGKDGKLKSKEINVEPSQQNQQQQQQEQQKKQYVQHVVYANHFQHTQRNNNNNIAVVACGRFEMTSELTKLISLSNDKHMVQNRLFVNV